MMVVPLSHVVDLAELEHEVEAGNITRTYHPEFPEIAMVNYTKTRAQSRRECKGWTPTERNSRGLIYNSLHMTVMSRPFSRFFDCDDMTELQRDFDLTAATYHVADSIPGELGIMYERPDGYAAMATRGSFDSEVALVATRSLQASVTGGKWHSEGICTPVFQLAPDPEQLFLLGAIGNLDGAFFAPDGVNADRASLRQVCARPATGHIVWLDQSTPVKITNES